MPPPNIGGPAIPPRTLLSWTLSKTDLSSPQSFWVAKLVFTRPGCPIVRVLRGRGAGPASRGSAARGSAVRLLGCGSGQGLDFGGSASGQHGSAARPGAGRTTRAEREEALP